MIVMGKSSKSCHLSSRGWSNLPPGNEQLAARVIQKSINMGDEGAGSDRLLNLNDCRLKKYSGNAPPPYDIHKHTDASLSLSLSLDTVIILSLSLSLSLIHTHTHTHTHIHKYTRACLGCQELKAVVKYIQQFLVSFYIFCLKHQCEQHTIPAHYTLTSSGVRLCGWEHLYLQLLWPVKRESHTFNQILRNATNLVFFPATALVLMNKISQKKNLCTLDEKTRICRFILVSLYQITHQVVTSQNVSRTLFKCSLW